MIVPQGLINEAKEKLGTKAAIEIANDLHFEQFDERNLKALCYWHKEDTPSLSWHTKGNYWNCFGCNFRYDIIDHYMSHHNLSFIEAIKMLFEKTNTTFDKFNNHEYDEDYFKNYKYPKEETNTVRDDVEEYLGRRHISKGTLDYAGVKQDKQGNIVFEHRDIKGKLLCTKYRNRGSSINSTAKTWWQKHSSTCPILYGIDRIDTTKPLLIVEGHIDRLSCIEAGYWNTVSIPHGATNLSWIDFNWNYIEEFESIILWADNDTAGESFIKEAVTRVGEYRCRVVKPGLDVEEKVKEFWNEYKLDINKTDANNVLIACGKQTILELINSAKEVEDKDIKDLMSFKYFSIQDREKFTTGLEALDKIIHGHLLKCLTLYTGYTGAGKTTAINQIALRAFLENNEKVFVFSGEMGGDKLMSWLLDSLAGANHIIEWDNGPDKPKGYSVTKQAIEAMQEFYMGNIKYYDRKGVVTTQELFEKMEYCRRRYGIKHFFIDNLMCLLTKGDEGDKWQSQIDFIIALSDFAESKDLGIHLVCHPKKPSAGQETQSIYDISGVSELANACNRAYWIKKINKPDSEYQSEITVLKDRETNADGKSAKLYYDHKTRRLYSNEEELNARCRWEESANIAYPKFVEERLVCNMANAHEEEYQSAEYDDDSPF